MKILMAFALLLASQFANAYADHCSEQRAEGYEPAICQGATIPMDRTRNLSSHRLECSSNSDNYVRRPQKFENFDRWSSLNDSGIASNVKAANLERRDPSNVPNIQWAGTIPYETVERWDWQACELHQDAAECGSHQENCHDVVTKSCDTDQQGRSVNCRSSTQNVCDTVANYCYYDVTYNESVHCSNEEMNYTAKFNRPTYAQWNPEKDGKVAQVLPNKYDLLPGEIENIVTSDNSGYSTTLQPHAEVTNAWNKYAITPTIEGLQAGEGARCEQGHTYNLNIAIDTLGRKMGKKGPNAFTLPVDVEGKPVDALTGYSKQFDKKTHKFINLRPGYLMLADSSAAMIQSISEISRKSTAREVAKIEAGKGQNADGSHLGDDKDMLAQSFRKNTIIRVKLMKVNSLWWDFSAAVPMKTSDVLSVRATTNVLSPIEEVRDADNYVIALDDADNIKKNIYARMLDGLQPNRVYELQVSMYQKGVPFYNQSCDDGKGTWRCVGSKHTLTRAWSAAFNGESAFFSDPIKVRFETPSAIDQRSFMQKLGAYTDPFALGEWIVHTRTTGANQ